MIEPSIFKRMKIKISMDGELLLLKNNYPSLRLLDIEKYLYGDSKSLSFINAFLNHEICLDDNVSIMTILKSFLPWKEQIGSIIGINIDSYIKYIDENSECESKEEKWEKIEFIKNYTVKKINNYSTSIVDIINNKKKREDYCHFSGYVGVDDLKINLIYYYNKENVLSSFSGDPLIDVSTYKNVPIFLSEEGKIDSNLFNSSLEGAELVKDAYSKETIRFKTKNSFSLIEILDHLSSLLYFYEPLSAEQKSENYKSFVTKFEKISDSKSGFKSDLSLIWEDIISKS